MTDNAQAVERKLEVHEKKDEAEVAGVQNQIVEHEQEDNIKWELTQAEFQALAEEQKETRQMVANLLDRLPPPTTPAPESAEPPASQSPSLEIVQPPAAEQSETPKGKTRRRKLKLRRRQ